MTAPFDLPANANVTGDDETFQSRNLDPSALALTNARTKSDSPESQGPLLDEPDEKKVAETITKWLRDQAKARRRRRVIATRNRMWLKGVRGIQVRPTNEDVTDIELYRAPGTLGLSSIMARAGQLIERVVAHLLSDQPAPEAEPENDTDIAREAAEVTTRILTVEGAESGFNTGSLLRRGARKSSVHGSAFLYPCVDPTGGGWRPMEIEALTTATTVDDAVLDPQTQLSVAAGDPRLTIRYVRPDKSLTDDPNEADKQWMPKIRVELLTPDHVAFIPEVCSGIADALGVLIIQYPTIAEARAKFSAFKALDDPDIRALMSWRPEDGRSSAPWDSAGERLRAGTLGATGDLDDSARICTLSLYFRSHGTYPKGAYIVISADKVLHKQTWSGMVEQHDDLDGGQDASQPYAAPDPSTQTAPGAPVASQFAPPSKKPGIIEECLDLPIAQIRQLDDDVDDDPMGHGLVDQLGEIDEQRAYILNAWNDYLDRLIHPIPFVPLGSIINPGVLQARTGDPVYFNPQGKPEYERVDPFPSDGKEFFDRTTTAGNDEVGLQQTAQGTEVSSVTSGAQAAVVVQQAAQNMASIKHNLADGTERFWRVVTQLIRVFYTIPMQAKYLGEDGSWRLTEWSRADLRSTRTIKIKAGTFTQLTAEQKEAKADKQLQMQVIDQAQYRDIIASGIRPILGLKENPHIIRVKRQISVWEEGPPEQWQPPQAPTMMGPAGPMPAVDPTTGQPAPAPPDPANPFADRRAVDLDPAVAKLRYTELARHQAEARYIRKPPAWRAYFDSAFDESRRGCGAYTLAEQQAAQAQQAQQAQQAAATTDAQSQAADHAHEERKLHISGAQRSADASAAHAARAADVRATHLLSGGSAAAPPAQPQAAPSAAMPAA